MLHASFHREILYRLLTQPTEARLRQIVRLGSSANQTARAISWMRQHFTEKIAISDLAKIAGMASPPYLGIFVTLRSSVRFNT
jgi:transcriptional regulator GlxA family with amidase domain